MRALLTPEARRWLLGLGLLTLSSWARWLGTGSLKVDENYPSERWGTVLLVVMLAGWALAVSGWAGLLQRPVAAPRRLAYAGLALMAVMLPLLSNDVFSLLSQDSLAAQAHHLSASTPLNPWAGWIGERWRDIASPYGPIAHLAVHAGAWGGTNPWLALAMLRATWLVPTVGVMELSFRLLPNRAPFHAMLWLNPLFLVEGPGQLHLDLVATLAVVVGMLAHRSSIRGGGAAAWAVATLCKWNLALAGLWFWLAGSRSARQRWRSGGQLMAALLGLGAVAYASAWSGPETFTSALRALATKTMVPGGSVVDVVGTLADAFMGIGSVFDPRLPVAALLVRQHEIRASAWAVSQVAMGLVALWALVPVARRLWASRDDDELALATGQVMVVVVTLASPKFQSWYLMMALPFFGLRCPPSWRRWWVATVATSVATEFALALPRDAAVFTPYVAISTLASVVVFLGSLRTRFGERADEGAPVGSTWAPERAG